MEVIVYEGPHLSVEQIETLVPNMSMEGGELTVCPCMSKEHLSLELARLAKQKIAQGTPFFRFQMAGDGFRFVKLSQIYCFYGRGHRIIAVLGDGEELESRTLRTATTKLLDPLAEFGQFLRIYRSCYVNISHITYMDPIQVNLDNGVTMKVSHQFYRAFKEPCDKI